MGCSRPVTVMQSHLVRVALPRACFGFVVRDGVVVECAPYGDQMLRRAGITRGREAVRFFRQRGASVSWVKLGDDAPGA